VIFAVAGTLTQAMPEWLVVETPGGVSYQILIHRGFKAPGLGETCKVWTYQVLREDLVALYGFGDLVEREVFGQLLAVSGVGPRLALALLETLGPAELVQAILKENSRALSLTPGVGLKTAQRIILDLKSRFEKWSQGPSAATGAVADDEVYLALSALGFTAQEINQALAHLRLDPKAPTEQWIKACIQYLSLG